MNYDRECDRNPDPGNGYAIAPADHRSCRSYERVLHLFFVGQHLLHTAPRQHAIEGLGIEREELRRSMLVRARIKIAHFEDRAGFGKCNVTNERTRERRVV